MAYNLDNLWRYVDDEHGAIVAESYNRLLLMAILAVAIEVRGLRRELHNRITDYPTKPSRISENN